MGYTLAVNGEVYIDPPLKEEGILIVREKAKCFILNDERTLTACPLCGTYPYELYEELEKLYLHYISSGILFQVSLSGEEKMT